DMMTSDEQIVKPVVSVYPAASRAPLEGRSSLLCVASAMFPPLVRFSWKRRKENKVESLPADGEQLKLRESGRTASILLVDRDDRHTYKYRCSVQHEGGTRAEEQRTDISFVSEVPALGPCLHQVKLLCVLYTVLIVKSLVYCCGLSLLRIL
uniref:Ig-like domain-containing protein n=1 Tax=Sparus aurata TaxID=8175 RepID=A0A671X1H9_SPAAU